jgi:uncharacterized protein YjbI with pentapeptide repeats
MTNNKAADMTKPQKPLTWSDRRARHGRLAYLLGFEWCLEWLVYWLRRMALLDVLELLGRFSVVVAVFFWFSERSDRLAQKHYRAWQVITQARGAPGDGGRRAALVDFNEDHIDLSAAPLAHAHLQDINLKLAQLTDADFSHTTLTGAQLSGANLTNANLRCAKLGKADLADANLRGALMRGVKMPFANLTGADLIGAQLIRADLPNSDLTKSRLNGANLTMSKLLFVNLSLSNLSGTCLYRTDLSQANLSGANLSGTDLTEATLAGVDLSKVDLSSARLCRTIMPNGSVENSGCVVDKDFNHGQGFVSRLCGNIDFDEDTAALLLTAQSELSATTQDICKLPD